MGSRRAPVVGFACVGLVLLAAFSAAQAQSDMNAQGVQLPGVEGGSPGEAPGGVPGGEVQPPQTPAWIFVPRIGLDEIVTDNARATSTNRQADLVSIVSPGIAVTADSARVKGALDYQLDVERFAETSDQNRIANNLFTNGQAIVVPNLLFFDARGSISQADVTGGRGFTNSKLIPEAQRVQVIAYSAGPTLRTDIGSLFNTEISYRASQTYFTNNTTVAGGAGLSNTTQHAGRFVFGTGEAFDRLHSAFIADALYQSGFGSSAGSNAGSGEIRKSAEVDNEYRITRAFSAIAEGGYEKLTFSGQSQLNEKGAIWGLGFAYDPNPDTRVRLVYGRRDGANDFRGELRFAITPATKAFITYNQQIETTQQEIIQALEGSSLGPGGTIINPTTGLPSTVVNPNFPLQNDIFRVKALRGGVISAVGRNTFTITGFREERISLAHLLPSETSEGGSFQWVRDINPDMSGSALVGYARDTIGSGPTINASVGITYHFSATLSGGVRYDFIKGGGGVGSAVVPVTASGSKFTQNAVTFSLRNTF